LELRPVLARLVRVRVGADRRRDDAARIHRRGKREGPHEHDHRDRREPSSLSPPHQQPDRTPFERFRLYAAFGVRKVRVHSRQVAKRLLERDQHEPRPDEELEDLKQMLRARAAAVSVRERELEQVERKLALRERRLGRRLRALRAERSWFTPVKNRFADSGQVRQVERMRADLARREQELAAREAEVSRKAQALRPAETERASAALSRQEGDLEQRLADLERRDHQLAESEQKLSERGREVDLREIAVAAVVEREAAVTAATELAAERERLLEERERQLGEREASLAAQLAEVEKRERKARSTREPSEKGSE